MWRPYLRNVPIMRQTEKIDFTENECPSSLAVAKSSRPVESYKGEKLLSRQSNEFSKQYISNQPNNLSATTTGTRNECSSSFSKNSCVETEGSKSVNFNVGIEVENTTKGIKMSLEISQSSIEKVFSCFLKAKTSHKNEEKLEPNPVSDLRDNQNELLKSSTDIQKCNKSKFESSKPIAEGNESPNEIAVPNRQESIENLNCPKNESRLSNALPLLSGATSGSSNGVCSNLFPATHDRELECTEESLVTNDLNTSKKVLEEMTANEISTDIPQGERDINISNTIANGIEILNEDKNKDCFLQCSTKSNLNQCSSHEERIFKNIIALSSTPKEKKINENIETRSIENNPASEKKRFTTMDSHIENDSHSILSLAEGLISEIQSVTDKVSDSCTLTDNLIVKLNDSFCISNSNAVSMFSDEKQMEQSFQDKESFQDPTKLNTSLPHTSKFLTTHLETQDKRTLPQRSNLAHSHDVKTRNNQKNLDKDKQSLEEIATKTNTLLSSLCEENSHQIVEANDPSSYEVSSNRNLTTDNADEISPHSINHSKYVTVRSCTRNKKYFDGNKEEEKVLRTPLTNDYETDPLFLSPSKPSDNEVLVISKYNSPSNLEFENTSDIQSESKNEQINIDEDNASRSCIIKTDRSHSLDLPSVKNELNRNEDESEDESACTEDTENVNTEENVDPDELVVQETSVTNLPRTVNCSAGNSPSNNKGSRLKESRKIHQQFNHDSSDINCDWETNSSNISEKGCLQKVIPEPYIEDVQISKDISKSVPEAIISNISMEKDCVHSIPEATPELQYFESVDIKTPKQISNITSDVLHENRVSDKDPMLRGTTSFPVVPLKTGIDSISENILLDEQSLNSELGLTDAGIYSNISKKTVEKGFENPPETLIGSSVAKSTSTVKAFGVQAERMHEQRKTESGKHSSNSEHFVSPENSLLENNERSVIPNGDFNSESNTKSSITNVEKNLSNSTNKNGVHESSPKTPEQIKIASEQPKLSEKHRTKYILTSVKEDSRMLLEHSFDKNFVDSEKFEAEKLENISEENVLVKGSVLIPSKEYVIEKENTLAENVKEIITKYEKITKRTDACCEIKRRSSSSLEPQVQTTNLNILNSSFESKSLGEKDTSPSDALVQVNFDDTIDGSELELQSSGKAYLPLNEDSMQMSPISTDNACNLAESQVEKNPMNSVPQPSVTKADYIMVEESKNVSQVFKNISCQLDVKQEDKSKNVGSIIRSNPDPQSSDQANLLLSEDLIKVTTINKCNLNEKQEEDEPINPNTSVDVFSLDAQSYDKTYDINWKDLIKILNSKNNSSQQIELQLNEKSSSLDSSIDGSSLNSLSYDKKTDLLLSEDSTKLLPISENCHSHLNEEHKENKFLNFDPQLSDKNAEHLLAEDSMKISRISEKITSQLNETQIERNTPTDNSGLELHLSDTNINISSSEDSINFPQNSQSVAFEPNEQQVVDASINLNKVDNSCLEPQSVDENTVRRLCEDLDSTTENALQMSKTKNGLSEEQVRVKPFNLENSTQRNTPVNDTTFVKENDLNMTFNASNNEANNGPLLRSFDVEKDGKNIAIRSDTFDESVSNCDETDAAPTRRRNFPVTEIMSDIIEENEDSELNAHAPASCQKKSTKTNLIKNLSDLAAKRGERCKSEEPVSSSSKLKVKSIQERRSSETMPRRMSNEFLTKTDSRPKRQSPHSVTKSRDLDSSLNPRKYMKKTGSLQEVADTARITRSKLRGVASSSESESSLCNAENVASPAKQPVRTRRAASLKDQKGSSDSLDKVPEESNNETATPRNRKLNNKSTTPAVKQNSLDKSSANSRTPSTRARTKNTDSGRESNTFTAPTRKTRKTGKET